MIKLFLILLLTLYFKDGAAMDDFEVSFDMDKSEAVIGESVILSFTSTSQFKSDKASVFKKQNDDNEPDLIAELTTEGILFEPAYASTGRIEPLFTENGRGSYSFSFTISDLRPSDSGFYGLEDNWLELKVAGEAYLGELTMTARRLDDGEFGARFDKEILHIDHDEYWEFICSVDGGSTLPTISVTFGDDDLNDRFVVEHEIIDHDADDFDSPHHKYQSSKVTATSDGDVNIDEAHKHNFLTCAASVEGVDSKTISVSFSFRTAPTIECKEVIDEGQRRDITLECYIDADPDPSLSDITWNFDDANGDPQSLTGGQSIEDGGVSAQRELQDDGVIRMVLQIQKKHRPYFKKDYTLQATNELGSESQTVSVDFEFAVPDVTCEKPIAVGRGQETTLICFIEADPEPSEDEISWEFTNFANDKVVLTAGKTTHDEDISATREIQDGKIKMSLHIPTLKNWHFDSKYKLIAINDIGPAEAEVWLIHAKSLDALAAQSTEGSASTLTQTWITLGFLAIVYAIRKYL